MENKKFDELVEVTNEKLDGLKTTMDQYQEKAKGFEKLEDSFSELKGIVDNLATVEGKDAKDYFKSIQAQVDSLEGKYADICEKQIKKQTGNIFAETVKAVKDPAFLPAVSDKSTSAKGYEIKDGSLMLMNLLYKSAAEMTTSSFSADTGAVAMDQYVIPGLEKHPWRTNPIFSAIRKVIVNEKVHSITWLDENSRVDGSDFKAESGAFGMSSNTFIKRVANFYKVGTYADFTEETIEDSELFAAELIDLLTNGVLRHVEYELLFGAGNNSNVFYGLINTTSALAKVFDAPTSFESDVPFANIYDALRVAKVQVRRGYGGTDSNKIGYNANLAIVSPEKMAAMDIQKDENGQYILPPFASNDMMVLKGMRVVESDDIGADQFLVGDFNKATAYIKRNLNIKYTESDGSKFLEDVLTAKASMRMAFKVTNFGAYGFVYDTFTDAIAQLLKSGQ